MKFKRAISICLLFIFITDQVGHSQTLYRSKILSDSSFNFRQGDFVGFEEFQKLEAREYFLHEKSEELSQIKFNTQENNLRLIQEYNQVLPETMEIQKLNAAQRERRLEVKTAQIQNRLNQAGERYILFKDGKKVTFKAGLTIRIENESLKDKLGNVSIRNTTNMHYNKKRELISYDQSIQDPLGNLTQVKFRNAQYWTKADQAKDPRRVEGKLANYAETIQEPTGLTTTRQWLNRSYYTKDDEKSNPSQVEGQLASYQQEIVGNDAPAAKRTIAFSEAQYIRRPATPTETDPSDEEDILLSSFHEKNTFLGIETERDFFDAQYNEHEQLVSYKEVSATLGVTTFKEWKNGTYDELGRLTAFDEVTVTDGVKTEREFRDAQYNSLGQLVSYTETIKTLDDVRVTHFSDAVYDEVGRLSSFKNTITENGVTFTQERSQILYNEEGLH